MGKNNRRFHKKPPQQAGANYKPPYSEEILAMSVEGLNLSVETLEILKKGGVLLLGDILSRRKTEMYKVQNFNKKRLFELQNAIAPLGVDFRPDEGSDASRGAEEKAKQTRGGNGAGDRRGEDRRPGGRTGDGRQDARQQGERQNDRKSAPMPVKGNREEDRRRAELSRGGNALNQQNRKQGKGDVSSKNKGNAVDFSKIFPREKLVHSPRIELEKDRFTKFQRAGKWGYKDENGKEVIPPIYTEALSFKEDMAAVEMNGLFGYINRENELVIPYKYDTAGSFSEGWANVSVGEKCGYIDLTGKETVPFIYDAATPFTGEGYGRVKKDGRWGNIRKNGEVSWQ